MKECKNCGTKSNWKFCHNCGQEVDIKRLTSKTVFHEIVFRGIFNFENSKIKTFKSILLSPGDSVRDYIYGKRVKHVKPFIYFLSIQTVFVLVFHWFSGNYYEYLNANSENRSDLEQMEHVIKAYSNYLDYFLPIFFSLFFYLFLKKSRGVNYAESVVASLYWLGTSLIFSVIFMVLSLYDARLWNAGILATSIFLIFAIMQFSEQMNIRGFIKGLLIIICSFITYTLFVLGVLQLYFKVIGSSVKVF
jgi:hypothetical protein